MSTDVDPFRELAAWTDTSPLYARLCDVVASDEHLQAIAAHGPSGISRANVFLAAVQYLLLRGAEGPLAAYYPSVTDDPRPVDEDLAPTFREFCLAHEDELVDLLNTRQTQTNAVRRSAALYPAFAHVAERTDGPLALVELGASAGLNLLWDRFRYDYDGRVVGANDAPVTLETMLRGSGGPSGSGDSGGSGGSDDSVVTGDSDDPTPPLPAEPPAVHSRVGLDLNPLDPTADADADWLRALVWPEHEDRRHALDGALAAAREDPPPVQEGDLADALPDLVADVPTDVPIVAYSTLVLYQVPEEVRRSLLDDVRDLASERPLHYLSGDEEHGDSDGIELTWTRAVEGDLRTDRLAVFEQHGRWLDWQFDSA